jgi:hypothetical protein
MRSLARAVLVAGAVLTLGCGDDKTGPSAASLVGTWNATVAEFYLQSNPTIRVEAISEYGATLTVTFAANNSYSILIEVPGEPDEIQTGTWSMGGDVLTLEPDGISGEIQFDAELANDILTLTGGHVMFDVDDDGTDDEAGLNLVMERVL